MASTQTLRVEVPPGEWNAVCGLVRWWRDEYKKLGNPPGTPLTIYLPPGNIRPFTLGIHDKVNEVDCTFMATGLLTLIGHPLGTHVFADASISDDTIALDVGRPSQWEGRVRLDNMNVQCSERSGLITITGSDPTLMTPYKEVTLSQVRFIEAAGIIPKWGILGNQCALNLINNCYCNIPHSLEHFCYVHNPYAGSLFDHVRVEGCGGNVFQFVSRPEEGPTYGRSTVTITNCDISGYHRNDDRASYAITIAGSGQDWVIEDNFIYDDNPASFWPPVGGLPSSGGSIVAWNDGRFYAIEDFTTKIKRVSGNPGAKHGNGIISIKRNQLGQPNANRDVIALSDALDAQVMDNGIWGGNGTSGRKSSITSGVVTYDWSGNCDAETISAALAAIGPHSTSLILGSVIAGDLFDLGVVKGSAGTGTTTGTWSR